MLLLWLDILAFSAEVLTAILQVVNLPVGDPNIALAILYVHV